uniref:sterile alpha motif domain-containing protein 9-like isoform X2 n=1 Tax=Myxine glutinosa TaxID=7769 RepID=UPI00358F59BA
MNCSLPEGQADLKEKTPMSLLNELADFNNLKPQYKVIKEEGPPHAKLFTVQLVLGEQCCEKTTNTIKKAKHMAAQEILDKTTLRKPVPRHLKHTTSSNSASTGQKTRSGAGEETSAVADQQSLPANMKDWDKNDVQHWLMTEVPIAQEDINKLYNEECQGSLLEIMNEGDLKKFGLPLGPSLILIKKRDIFLKQMEAKEREKAKKSGNSHKINKPEKSKTRECYPYKQEGLNESTDDDKNGSGTSLVGQSSDFLMDENEMLASRTAKVCSSSKHQVDKKIPKVSKESLNAEIPSSHHFYCSPHPFDEMYSRQRYNQGGVLPPESGKFNYLEPAHEYKLFECLCADDESEMKKFCNEVFRFAGGCMNRRTNGTIHFGVGDKVPGKQTSLYVHGEVVGVQDDGSRDKFGDCLKKNFTKYFDKNDIDDANDCVRPPRFVEVISKAYVTLNKHVIEVDIVPKGTTCGDKVYNTKQMVFAGGKWEADNGHIYLRDGASTTDIKANQNERIRIDSVIKLNNDVQKWTKERQSKEDMPKVSVKGEDEGKKLEFLLTGGKGTLDNSRYKTHILVVNKATKDQLKALEFVQDINWLAVLDFDPESNASGLCSIVRPEKAVNLHFPRQYVENNNKDKETMVTDLHLYKQTSWIFCNGRAGMTDKRDMPMDPREFWKKRSMEIRNLVQFLCHEDITPRRRVIVVFLVLFEIQDPIDPFMEIFFNFYQELGGLEDVLLITGSAETFQSWTNIAKPRLTEEELQNRSISRSNLQHVNCTIQKIKSATRSDKRYLRTSSGTDCTLKAADEEFLSSIKILCSNECEGTAVELQKEQFDESRKIREEAFYRGDKVSPWNFYFAEKTGNAFIKRDQFDSLVECIESAKTGDVAVKTVNLFHHPGCGGTTLAWHVLWHLKKKYRCAAVKDNEHDYQEISKHVVKLLTFGESDPDVYTPVVLLIDDLEELENVNNLAKHIRSSVYESKVHFETPVVIILNCMRSQDPIESQKKCILESVHLEQQLSANEKHLFEEKLKEIKKEHKEIETFLSFMIMKESFREEYIRKAVGNMLKGIERETKDTKLISYLALLNHYVKNSCISVSKCEALLGVSTVKQLFWGRETLEEALSSQARLLLIRFRMDEVNGTYESMKINHPLVALQILKILEEDFAISQDDIAKDLLEEDCLFELGMGRSLIECGVRRMMITRQRKQLGDDKNTLFSPLIEEVKSYQGPIHENRSKILLIAATHRFPKDAFLAQALARYCDIEENDFEEAKLWGKKAMELSPQNSCITDTNGQTFKHQLQKTCNLEEIEREGLSALQLQRALELAKNASHFFKKAQELAKKEDDDLNTSGFYGEVQTSLHFIELLSCNKVFDKTNPIKKMTLVKYLKGECDLSRIPMGPDEEEATKETVQVLKRHESYLRSLHMGLKENLELLESIHTFSKARESENELEENKNYYTIRKYFRRYLDIFISDIDLSEGKGIAAKYSSHNKIEKMSGDRFSGLYQLLLHVDATGVEAIVKEYENIGITTASAIREKQNYVFACVILHCLNKKSKHLPPYQQLVPLVKSVVRDAKQKEWRHPDPFFLGSMFFSPDKHHPINKDDIILLKDCTEMMRRLYRLKFGSRLHTRQPLAMFFLGKGEGLNRILPRGKIDEVSELKKSRKSLKQLWQSGEILKDSKVQDLLLRVNGVTSEEGQHICVNFGFPAGEDHRLQILIRPVSRGQLRRGQSIERVSFFMGFSMDGFLAYDVQSIG